MPDVIFDDHCERELGLQNVEFHTDAESFDGEVIAAQAAQLRRHYRSVQHAADQEGVEIVLDGMWTIPPPEGSHAYLADVRESDGVTIAENMTPSP